MKWRPGSRMTTVAVPIHFSEIFMLQYSLECGPGSMSAPDIKMPETDILHIHVLCFDGAHASSVFDFHEVLSVAGKVSGPGGRAAGMRLSFVGAQRRTRLFPGVNLATEPLAGQPDLVLIPGIEHERGRSPALLLPGLKAETDYVRRCQRQGAWIGAVCGGTFLAAAATSVSHCFSTSWWLEPEFRRCFPQHRLGPHVLTVARRLITAGAVSSSYLVAVRGLEKLAGRKVADLTGRFLVLRTGVPPQSAFAVPAALLADAEAEAPLAGELRKHVLEGAPAVSVRELARKVGLSARQLLRRVRAETGMPVSDWIHQVRVERLRELLRLTDRKWSDLSLSVGYIDPFHASRCFKRVTGMSPSQFRVQHQP